jgi:phage tail-like protein
MATKEAGPNSFFRMAVGGAEKAAAFRKLTGLKVKIEVIKTWTVDEQGRPKQISIPGRTTWDDITLERVVDDNDALSKWCMEVAEKGPAGARKDCTIEQVDYMGKQIAAYELTAAWPCEYTPPEMNADQNGAAYESIKLAHDGCKRVK